MEKRRIEFLNATRIRITQLKNSIKRDTETISNLKNLYTKKEDYEKKKESMLNKIQEKNDEIETLEEKEGIILEGGCDDEIKETLVANPKKELSVAKISLDKKTNNKPDIKIGTKKVYEPVIEVKTVKPVIATPTSQQPKNSKERKKERQEQKQAEQKEYNRKKYESENYYRFFCKAIETIPDYMTRNLKTMPNNKGYIWKGCWFFGDLPAEKNEPMVMSNKPYKQEPRTYVISDTDQKIFEKGKDGRKKLIATVKRNEPIISF